MKSIIRRIEKLEKRYMPAPETAFSKELASAAGGGPRARTERSRITRRK